MPWYRMLLMRRTLSWVFLRVPERNLFLACFGAVVGCVVLALTVSGLAIKTPPDLVSTLNTVNLLILGSLQFVVAALYALPDHRRRAKQRLRAAILLVCLVVLAIATVAIAA